MDIIIKFYNTNSIECSNSSLSICIDNKKYFFNNTNSWVHHKTNNPIIELEYLCLPNKSYIDTIEITADNILYQIYCDQNILIHNNHTLSLKCYLDLKYHTFSIDNLDKSSYHKTQIFCDSIVTIKQIPTIETTIYNTVYRFDQWYNCNDSLLFYSKNDLYKCHAYIQILHNKSIFYMITNFENIKDTIIYQSISSYILPNNEIGQIHCDDIRLNFCNIKPLRPILIAPISYIDINNIDQNISIKTTYDHQS